MELENITFIKMIMMLFVVLYHSLLFYSNNWFTSIKTPYDCIHLHKISQIIDVFTMPIFVFCSGYIFYYLKNNYNKYKNYKKDIIKRVKRLIIPYISTSILWAIPISLIFYDFTIKDFLKKYLLAESPSQLWFLIMLFGVFIIFYFLSRKLKFTPIEFLVFLVTTMLLSYVVKVNYFQIHNIIYYSLFYYYSGFLFYNGEKMFKRIINKKNMILIFTLVVILFVFFYGLFDFNSNIIKNIVLVLLRIIILSYTYLLINVSKLYFLNNKKVFSVLIEYSFGIFLFHQQIIYFMLFYFNGLVCPEILSLMCFVCAIIVSMIIVYVVKKYKITRYLFGMS